MTDQFESREKALEAAVELYTSLTMKMHRKGSNGYKTTLIDAGAWYIVRIHYPKDYLFWANEIRQITEHERFYQLQLDGEIIRADYIFDIQNDKR